MKRSLLVRFLIGSLVSLSSASLAVATVAWFAGAGGQIKQHIDGEIGLRGYFYAGDGSVDSPFEITAPNHLYNLCRLQSLGIFSEKKCFQIGHKNESTGKYECIAGYSEGNPIWGDYLNMEGTSIAPIGSEATPFVGDFDGHGVPVVNLDVKGYPEDIGFFGYISYEGTVTGLVLENVDIYSLGYDTDSLDETYQLFHPEIDDLFNNNAHRFVHDTSLSFFSYDSTEGEYVETTLKHENGLSGVTYSNINHTDNLVEIDGDPSTIYNGYFLPTFPSNDPVFTYSWRASSSLIREERVIDINEDGKNDDLIMFNLGLLSISGSDERGFNNTESNMQVETRLSLYATCVVDNYTYSRVIQSYTIDFFNNQTAWANGGYSVSIFCDYVASSDPLHKVTNYHHGNNIGFIAGHLDGSMSYCYVYGDSTDGCHFYFNDDDYHPIEAESDLGLVGEVGKNVINSLDPDIGLAAGGDTGVMNFTKIYEGIRSNFTAGSTIKAGHNNSPTANYVCYDTVRNNSDASLFNNYKQYLRYMTISGTKKYVTSVGNTIGSGTAVDDGDDALTWHNHIVTTDLMNNNSGYNSVDFLWNQVIEDDLENNKDRGLGVFKIATVHTDGVTYSDSISTLDMCKDMGGSSIYNGTDKTKVYFSTAEYNHTISGTGTAWSEYAPLRGTSLPSYSDTLSFNYPFSRDYNYCFELDLADMNKSQGYNYMSNTDSDFLSNYLSSVLIDKKGDTVARGSKRFGFMFRSSTSQTLSALSSYMPVSYPAKNNKSQYGLNYYPANSIVFKIDNENGANVSVVGNGSDITIYRYNPAVSGKSDIVPLYTMKSSSANDGIDQHRYFTYDVETGATATETTTFDNNMRDGKALYAHIFKLPQGNYVIGSSADNTTANVYFLAVQGQTDADLGSDIIADIGNTLSNVDFLTGAPTRDNYPSSLSLAELSFNANFNTESNGFEISVKEDDGLDYLWLKFEDNPLFVTYLSAYSSSNSPKYFIRDEELTKIFHVYRSH